jgi:hypothetical protein
MPSLTMLFTLFMLPGVCMLATSFVVARLEQGKKSLVPQS